MKALFVTVCLLFTISSLHAQCLDFKTFYSLKDKDLKGVEELFTSLGWTIKKDTTVLSDDLSPYNVVSYKFRKGKNKKGLDNRIFQIIYRQVSDTITSIAQMTSFCSDQRNYINFLKSMKESGFSLKDTGRSSNKTSYTYTEPNKECPMIIINEHYLALGTITYYSVTLVPLVNKEESNY